ncbi:unnamed protein product, partial [Sphacelaria rigidula]
VLYLVDYERSNYSRHVNPTEGQRRLDSRCCPTCLINPPHGDLDLLRFCSRASYLALVHVPSASLPHFQRPVNVDIPQKRRIPLPLGPMGDPTLRYPPDPEVYLRGKFDHRAACPRHDRTERFLHSCPLLW